jgi:hypothetical protein
MVVLIYNPSYAGGIDRRIASNGSPRWKAWAKKQLKQEKAGVCFKW